MLAGTNVPLRIPAVGLHHRPELSTARIHDETTVMTVEYVHDGGPGPPGASPPCGQASHAGPHDVQAAASQLATERSSYNHISSLGHPTNFMRSLNRKRRAVLRAVCPAKASRSALLLCSKSNPVQPRAKRARTFCHLGQRHRAAMHLRPPMGPCLGDKSGVHVHTSWASRTTTAHWGCPTNGLCALLPTSSALAFVRHAPHTITRLLPARRAAFNNLDSSTWHVQPHHTVYASPAALLRATHPPAPHHSCHKTPDPDGPVACRCPMPWSTT